MECSPPLPHSRVQPFKHKFSLDLEREEGVLFMWVSARVYVCEVRAHGQVPSSGALQLIFLSQGPSLDMELINWARSSGQ